MLNTLKEVWGHVWIRLLTYGLLLTGVIWLVVQASSALTTLILGFGFAYLTSPIVRAFERLRLPRWLGGQTVPRFIGVIAVYLGLLLFIGLASLLMAQMATQIALFAASLPNLVQPLVAWAQGLPEQVGRIQLSGTLQAILNQASASLQSLLSSLSQGLLGALQGLLAQGGNLVNFVASLLGGVFQLFTALTISIYFLYDLPRIARAALQVFPEPYQPRVLEVASKLDRAVGGYVRGQLLVAACVGSVVGIGLWIVGIPLAASLGFLAAVFNLIPYVGIVISSVPAILLAATLGFQQVLLTVLVLWLANQLEGNFFGPRIVGQATSLHPTTSIAAILIGSTLFGLPGALLGVPAAAFFKALYQDYYLTSNFHKKG